MARSHARLELAMFSIDRDRELGSLSKDAKLLYVVLLTDPAVNQAGVVLLRTGVWSEEASLDDDEFEQAFSELEKTEFVVVDRRTSELLVRSFIRNDKVAEQPNVLKGALSQAKQARSRKIRRAIAVELWRLPPKPPDRIGKNGHPVVYPDPHAVAQLLDPDGDHDPGTSNPSPNPSSNPPPNPSGNPSPNPSSGTHDGTLPGRDEGTPGGSGRGSTSSTDGSRETSKTHTRAPRAERAPEGFAEFWAAYPRKEGKRAAEKAYAAARKREVPAARLLVAAKRYAAVTAHTEDRFVAHPATWLNQGRYDDEPAPRLPAVGGPAAPSRVPTTTQRVRDTLALLDPEGD